MKSCDVGVCAEVDDEPGGRPASRSGGDGLRRGARPELWPQVSVDAGRVVHSAQIMLGVIDRSGREVSRAVLNRTGRPTGPFGLHHAREQPGDRLLGAHSADDGGSAGQWVSDSDLERSEFYQTSCGRSACGTLRSSTCIATNPCLRRWDSLRARKERPFGERELADLRRLAPHLNRALRVTLKLRDMEARADAVAGMGDRALVALVLTDAAGRIAETNGRARDILAEGDGLFIRDGALRAALSEDCARLARLIREAAGSRVMPMSGVMRVGRPSLRRPLPLVVSPSRNAASPFGRSHAVCVSFADPERAPEANPDLLARLYGFTGREASVAASLVQGRSPAEAAAELAMTENTVRTHIRHAFDKTGVERLSDFVRLLMQGPGVG